MCTCLFRYRRSVRYRRWGRFHKREERDPTGAGVWGTQAELCRPEPLGTGLLRIDHGSDEALILDDIRMQEQEDRRLDQMMWR